MTKKQLEEKVKNLEKLLNILQEDIDALNQELEETQAEQNIVPRKEFDRLLKDLENERNLKESFRNKSLRLEKEQV